MPSRVALTRHDLYQIAEGPARKLATKLAEHDAALDAVSASAGQRETVTTGVVAPLVGHTDITVSGTVPYTMAVGIKEGQLKTIRCTTAAATPAGTLTAAFSNAGVASASVAFSATTFYLFLAWDATLAKWVVKYAVGATFA